jgi:hypothetical protein
MYRQGLGDCLLLTFDPDGTPVHMLIDCGTLGATTTGVRMAEVVANIRKTTNDHLHVLIATHEHQDHLSGFNSAKKEFEKIRVDNVWLAWTEDPTDDDAKRLKKYANDLGISVALASHALAEIGKRSPDAKELGEAIDGLLGFFGEQHGALAVGDFAESVDAAMDFVRTRVAKARHLEPRDLIEETWLPGFRFYILGPPRNPAALNEVGDHETDSLYHVAGGLRAGSRAAVHSGALDPANEEEMPFDQRFRLDESDSLGGAARKRYMDSDAAWRRIDGDWLQSAGSLALQLDSITNNTSLAFAIERISDGKVLLFPADGQLGHWLSWHDAKVKWTVPDRRGAVTASDLLRETVFYKVGHHASHNATAKDKGLEMMTRTNELVAFIPVDRQVALKRNPQGSWQMPALGLYRRLLEKCQGRVLRSDLGWADDAKNAANPEVEEGLKKIADEGTWKEYRKAQQAVEGKNVKVDRLFIDYTLT